MNPKTSMIHRGSCQCGAINYEVEGQPKVVAHCHCENCQRGSGAGHTTGAMFSKVGFQLTGKVSEYRYKSDNGNVVTRVFCPACGSPIFGRNSGLKGYLTITLGTMDDSSGFEPEVVVYKCNRKKWDAMDETLLAFEAQPNWKPDDDS